MLCCAVLCCAVLCCAVLFGFILDSSSCSFCPTWTKTLRGLHVRTVHWTETHRDDKVNDLSRYYVGHYVVISAFSHHSYPDLLQTHLVISLGADQYTDAANKNCLLNSTAKIFNLQIDAGDGVFFEAAYLADVHVFRPLAREYCGMLLGWLANLVN